MQIWRELAPHYFPADCFGGSSNSAGTGSTLFSIRLFWRPLRFGGNWLHIISRQIVWRQLKFGGNWLHIIFRQIVLEMLRELAPHYYPVDSFGRQLRLGGSWLHIIFRQIVLEAAQIWREMAPHYFPVNCFGNLEGTGSTLVSGR